MINKLETYLCPQGDNFTTKMLYEDTFHENDTDYISIEPYPENIDADEPPVVHMSFVDNPQNVKAGFYVNLSLEDVDTLIDMLTIAKRQITGVKENEWENKMGKKESEIDKKRRLLNTRINELPFDVRTRNCLKAKELETLRDVVTCRSINSIRGLGKKSLTRIKDYLESVGLSLEMDVSMYD